MRITFITHDAGLYGANRSLLDLIDGLAPFGVEPAVIGPGKGKLGAELDRRNIPFHRCDVARWVSTTPDAFAALPAPRRFLSRGRSALLHATQTRRAVRKLKSILRQTRPDIVETNTSVVLSGALAARRLGIPHIWHLREFGDLDYDYHFDFGKALHKWVIHQTTAAIAVTAAVRKHFLFAEPSPIKVVYGGIAPASQFDRLRDAADRVARRPGAYRFALIGLLHPGKGQDVAIRAVHRLVRSGRDPHLLLAGTGRQAYRACLENLVRDLSLEKHVEFLGYENDVFGLLLQSDAVLMCSRNEAMGRVTAEAMASCRPVIGFRGGGTEELIEDGQTGYLYDGDYEALAAAMMSLMDDPDTGRDVGRRAWRFARERFTIERYASESYDIYKTAASQRVTDSGEAPLEQAVAVSSPTTARQEMPLPGRGHA